MAKTIVIKNVDFSTNKLDTVSFGGNVPCTAIALNVNSLSITSIGGTSTLTATPTPSNTTDPISWSTSDSNVATVADGVVTATGCGTATITVTCGSYSANCSVSVVHVVTLTHVINSYIDKDNNKNYLTGSALANYDVAASSTGTKKIARSDNGTFDSLHPVMIPNGANTISITSTGFRPYGYWLSSTESATLSDYAYAYPKDDNFKSNSSINDSRTVPIPDRTTGTFEGVDSCAFCFKCNSTITQEAVDAIVVTFSKVTT